MGTGKAKPHSFRVSDHAVLRAVERLYKIDTNPIREEIIRTCRDAIRLGARSLRVGDVMYSFQTSKDDPEMIVITTVLDRRMRSTKYAESLRTRK